MVLSSEVWTTEELAGTQHTWVTWTEKRGKWKTFNPAGLEQGKSDCWAYWFDSFSYMLKYTAMGDPEWLKQTSSRICAHKSTLFSPGFERCCVFVHILQILCPTGTSSCHESRCIAFSHLQATIQTVPYAQISSITLKHQLHSTTQTNVLTPIKTILRKSVISNRGACFLHIENMWKNKDRVQVLPKNMTTC